MLFACCFFQLFTNLPVYFKKELNFSKPFIGLLMAANGILIALIEMVLIYKLDGKRKNTLYIAIGVFVVGLSFLLLNIPGAAIAVAVSMIVLITLGEILSMPFMNSYWIARTQPSNRGQYAALYTMAWSAAQTLGPMGGAHLAEHAGFNVLWWSVGGLCIIASLSFWKLHKNG
jgi:predicted MFS family arabinose efflux permease